MKIALDVMGGDYAPVELLAGAVKWLQESEGQIILVGDQEIINEELRQYSYDPTRLEIIHASQVIGMNESPAVALRKKKDASIVVASRLVKDGMADAVVSCGSTGAQMAAAIFILGRMQGVERPPIVAPIPGRGGKPTLLIDVGANVDCRPVQLLQFALLGQAYARGVLNLDNPRIGLLNNGEEEGKGNDMTKQAGPLMAAAIPNFIGNIEGKELFGGKVDVAITDGFTGNVLLKSVEAVAKLILTTLKTELMSSTRTKIGALLAKPAFDEVRKMLDPNEIGSAPLLGLDGLVFIGHGRSNAKAIVSAIEQAVLAVESNLLENLRNSIILQEK